MKDYRHMMRQITLSDEKKEKIMEMLEHKQPQKRRMPKAARIMLVAALMVGCVLCIAAGLPYQMYHFLAGGFFTSTPGSDGNSVTIGGGSMTLPGRDASPLVLEDGRLWFVNGKERTDITDLIDEDIPYIYEHTDSSSGNKGYVILGGTVDNFGWAEYVSLGGGSGMTGENYSKSYVTLDGERFLMSELTDEQRERIQQMTSTPPEERMDEPIPLAYETIYSPWLEAAMEQLGIEHY